MKGIIRCGVCNNMFKEKDRVRYDVKYGLRHTKCVKGVGIERNERRICKTNEKSC